MSLSSGITEFTNKLDAQKISYGIIGGIAVFAYGGERTTFDVDFLIEGKYRSQILAIAQQMNLNLTNENSEVLQFSGSVQIDIIFANRPTTQGMLHRLQRLDGFDFPVVAPEDLIGLKIQAFVADRKREFLDKGDIITIMRNRPDLDFNKIKEYADIFNVWNEICDLKNRL